MTGTTTKTPMRLCVGCGERDAQLELRRFVLAGGVVAWDVRRRAPGRGAYLHPRSRCLDRFERRKPYVRSLRASVPREDRRRLAGEVELRS